MKNRNTHRRSLLVGFVATAAGIFAINQGFTASNTVSATKAGDGSSAISGYVVSSVHYALNTIDPSKIDTVTFALDSAPTAGSTMKIQLAPAGSWYTCTNAAVNVTCSTTALPQPTVATATALRVVVAQ